MVIVRGKRISTFVPQTVACWQNANLGTKACGRATVALEYDGMPATIGRGAVGKSLVRAAPAGIEAASDDSQ